MRIATHIHRDKSNGPITKLRSYEDGQSPTSTRDEPVNAVITALLRGEEYRVKDRSGPSIAAYIRSEQDGKVTNNLEELPTF